MQGQGGEAMADFNLASIYHFILEETIDGGRLARTL
jgi:hypothetical protein